MRFDVLWRWCHIGHERFGISREMLRQHREALVFGVLRESPVLHASRVAVGDGSILFLDDDDCPSEEVQRTVDPP